MLVHAKNPRGVLYLAGRQIWGKETGRKPVDLPFNIYNANKEALQDATYREGYLGKLFGNKFPEVAFTYSEVRWLPDDTLLQLAHCMNIKINGDWTRKGLIDAIKEAIRNISPK